MDRLVLVGSGCAIIKPSGAFPVTDLSGMKGRGSKQAEHLGQHSPSGI